MKSGQCLSHDFINGLNSQTVKLDLNVFSSECLEVPKRENMFLNWKNAFRSFLKSGDDYLVGIDSDVILTNENAISDLIDGLNRYDLTAIKTRQCQKKRNTRGINRAHAFFAIKRSIVEGVEYKKEYDFKKRMTCPNCLWANTILGKGYRVGFATDYCLKEM